MMSVLEVSEQRLLGNLRAIERVLGDAAGAWVPPALLGVVKADGYGHSARLCAPMLVRGGVRWLGVTDAEEGAAVRESLRGAEAEILVMLGPPGDAAGARQVAELAVRHRLTPVVWTLSQVSRLVEAAGDEQVAVHVEVDTGMSRQGVLPGAEMLELLQALRGERRIRLDGVLTHFASAECTDGRQTLGQLEVFAEAVRSIAAIGLEPRWVHVGNASTIDNGAVEAAGVIARLCGLAQEVGARAMVRCGLAMYGLCLPLEGSEGEARLRPLLQPVLTWKTSVLSVQTVAAGSSIGYGATFTARQAMRVALLPIGYADGLRRGLSGTDERVGGWVMIGGRRAQIVGRVSMNLTTVDVTSFNPAVQAGDEAIVLGDGVSAEDHAAICGASPYEIVCGLKGRHVAG